jgi:hypothetical protein
MRGTDCRFERRSPAPSAEGTEFSATSRAIKGPMVKVGRSQLNRTVAFAPNSSPLNPRAQLMGGSTGLSILTIRGLNAADETRPGGYSFVVHKGTGPGDGGYGRFMSGVESDLEYETSCLTAPSCVQRSIHGPGAHGSAW